MKLHHFISNDAKALQDLGRSIMQPQVSKVAEARKVSMKPKRQESDEEGMDAAVHTMTQDQKHLHKKIAQHD
jgi:hypothetical protein